MKIERERETLPFGSDGELIVTASALPLRCGIASFPIYCEERDKRGSDGKEARVRKQALPLRYVLNFLR